ncbi:PE family protein [Mycobacterium uberis]|uniref:PE family protein n=1 Tax=Mycobacterium uberis TaxID=2162698 RepID=UPI000E30857D
MTTLSAATASTMQLAAAGTDETPATIATVFNDHIQVYQKLGTQAAGSHDQICIKP